MDQVRVEQGGLSDYERLAVFHYRSGRPAVPVLTLRARCGGETVGVLVVAAPVLNGPWRVDAWPGWLAELSKREAAHAVNRELRCIARLVVAPPFRARGVGSRLVRAYLAAPLTPRTEALAAMAPVCPVFERAGMRRVSYPLSRARRRVLRVLRARRVPPWSLADPALRQRLARDSGVCRAFQSLAVERWRAGKDRSAQELIDRLWVHAAGCPVAFVAG